MEIEIPSDNVIEGEFGKGSEMRVEHLPDDRVFARKYRATECTHSKVWLDGDNHCLECQSCGRVVDPIKYLQRFADRERALDNRVSMIKEFKRREAAQRERERRKHMPREDWKKTQEQIRAEHKASGCPKQHMWFTKTMAKCYCGLRLSRTYSKDLEREVRNARRAAEQREKMRLVV